MRQSTLPKKRFKIDSEKRIICIGCKNEITDGFYYTGSVISGTRFFDKKTEERTPILGSIETHEKIYIIGGEILEGSKRVGYLKREKGEICCSCASNYHTVEDNSGNKHPLVKTDPNPRFMGNLAMSSRIAKNEFNNLK